MSYCTFFIGILTKGRDGAIKASQFDAYIDFSSKQKIVDLELAAHLEVTHYILNWLFDLMQFCFQYLVISDKVAIPTQMQGQVAPDPTGPLSIEEDFLYRLRFSFYVENFGSFISLVSQSVTKICPQTDYLNRFW